MDQITSTVSNMNGYTYYYYYRENGRYVKCIDLS